MTMFHISKQLIIFIHWRHPKKQKLKKAIMTELEGVCVCETKALEEEQI